VTLESDTVILLSVVLEPILYEPVKVVTLVTVVSVSFVLVAPDVHDTLYVFVSTAFNVAEPPL